jgi:hypothetical protein
MVTEQRELCLIEPRNRLGRLCGQIRVVFRDQPGNFVMRKERLPTHDSGGTRGKQERGTILISKRMIDLIHSAFQRFSLQHESG